MHEADLNKRNGVPKVKVLKQKVSITLDIDVKEKIQALSDAQDRSFSQYINMVLKEHLKRAAPKGASICREATDKQGGLCGLKRQVMPPQ